MVNFDKPIGEYTIHGSYGIESTLTFSDWKKGTWQQTPSQPLGPRVPRVLALEERILECRSATWPGQVGPPQLGDGRSLFDKLPGLPKNIRWYWYCWWFRNPQQPPGMYKNPVNNKANYLWTGAGFLPSTVLTILTVVVWWLGVFGVHVLLSFKLIYQYIYIYIDIIYNHLVNVILVSETWPTHLSLTFRKCSSKIHGLIITKKVT